MSPEYVAIPTRYASSDCLAVEHNEIELEYPDKKLSAEFTKLKEELRELLRAGES